jgi:hypothetical protein
LTIVAAQGRSWTEPALAFCGIAGGVVWALLPIFAPESGAPRAEEELFNRLWAPLLVLIALGFVALRRRLWGRRSCRVGLAMMVTGILLMVAGNVAEYWFFHSLAHGTASRDLSWMTVLLGWLMASISGTIAGIGALVGRLTPRWVALPLCAMLPATILLIAIAIELLGVPLAVASVASGVWLTGGRSTVDAEIV